MSDPVEIDAAGRKELFREILAAVSRSFYLTLRVLPAGVREPIGLAYLLARASDSVADTARCDGAVRLAILERWMPGLEGEEGGEGENNDFLPRLEAVAAALEDEGERRLLERMPALLTLYRTLPVEDREAVRQVLETIVSGQRADLMRFEAVGKGEGGGVVALETARELDDYTWRVAGCVGEFWTRLCFRHVPGYATLGEVEMVRLGRGFGKGLQLVNILRDLPEDLRAGRCYLPAEELQPTPPERVLEQPEKARAVVARWMTRCEARLAEGYAYLEAVRPWRLRLAVFLPWAIAVRTVALMKRRPPLETRERVKVSRQEVRGLLLQGLAVAVSQSCLYKFATRNQ